MQGRCKAGAMPVTKGGCTGFGLGLQWGWSGAALNWLSAPSRHCHPGPHLGLPRKIHPGNGPPANPSVSSLPWVEGQSIMQAAHCEPVTGDRQVSSSAFGSLGWGDGNTGR